MPVMSTDNGDMDALPNIQMKTLVHQDTSCRYNGLINGQKQQRVSFTCNGDLR